MTTANPLLEPHELPPFEQFTPEQVEPAMTALIDDVKATIEQVLADPEAATWESVIAPIEEKERALDNAWALFSHLSNVKDSPELRDAYGKALGQLTEFSTWVGQHAGLFKAYQSISERDDFSALSEPQQEAVRQALLEFRLSGIDLPEDQQKTFATLKNELAQLSQTFSEQLLDATQSWTKHITDESELAGLPETAKATLAQYAKQKDKDGWLITLEMPSVLPVLTYADNRALREEVYRANVSKASDKGPDAGKFDNGPIMTQILEKRQQVAELLGYRHHADVSLATKMADSPEDVIVFLDELAEKALPQAKEEFAELSAFAAEKLNLPELQPWDVTYASEKLKQQTFSVSQEELRPYFPANKVLVGLFETVTRLFNVTFEPAEGYETYHPDVQLHNVYEDGKLIARFFLDLYAREGKRGGAWMDECRTRMKLSDDKVQIPVAYLTCNFTPPVDGKPSLLTHDEVTTLFHEFGHGLHHMLTRVDVKPVSGINGVAWDAVELPSQFLENWCWEEEALAFISGHVDTREPLPKDLLDKLLAAKNFQSAMAKVRQLEFSLFDMHLHMKAEGFDVDAVQSLLDTVRDQVSVVPRIDDNRFQNGFGHIFGGGYAAGYYSYKWAEVLSADAYSRFEEEGIFNEQTGADFRNIILANGGSKPAAELFKAFRGREPSVEPLLRHNGIKAA
ncbi:M3 family metallopeptidase [Reinekea blandensis]|uniref:oligopeptidase A n=1 Tax=Reinekea blandensis MED297 TaxID=314283 RepID=A4BA78_9GAMM|nr:M3 family metallopeptidase [Reinekea blandensis]EAR10834.1 oligopeptidase A [Reinekea sp. MED297] [Reinekea blandensis MED297]